MPRNPAVPQTVERQVPANGRDEVAALARGIAVLRTLMAAPRALSNRELADATGIPKATVSRLANTLVMAGYVQQDAESEKYRLGAGLLELSEAYLRHFDMRTLCRPHLAALADRTQVSVHLGLRDGLEILVIDTHRPRSAVILTRTDVGTRMDIATSASGRAFFASLPESDQEAVLSLYQREAPQRWSQVRSALALAVEEYADKGYCTSFREWHKDINAIGISLRGPRGELYALSCGGPAYLSTADELNRDVAPDAVSVGAAIESACGVRPQALAAVSLEDQ